MRGLVEQQGPANRDTAVLCGGHRQATGRAPYGYRPGGRPQGRAVEPDPRTAPVVRRIFEEYASGSGLSVIAERLTAEGVPCPSAYDQQRNPNHAGSAWSKVAVRAIITNDRYVAGHRHTVDPRRPGCGCGAAGVDREALVPVDVYRRTREILARRGEPVRSGRCAEQAPGRYALRGLLRCELCQRLMQGTWNNRAAYYRCRFPREYARANNIDHPANVYLREDRLLPALRGWIHRSLPARLYEWTRAQPPPVRLGVAHRAGAVCTLIARATADPPGTGTGTGTGTGDLYAALNLALVYQPRRNAVLVSAEALPGAVILDTINV